jgi:hypothetical protein
VSVALSTAVLLEIAGPGALDDSGDPGAPVPVWTGRAAGYLKRERRSVVRDGNQVDVRQDIFLILRAAGAPVLESAGPDWTASTLVIEDRRTPTAVTRRFTVTAMENRAAGTAVDSIRVELDTETAA